MGNNEKLTSLIQKKKISNALEKKLMQKLKKKPSRKVGRIRQLAQRALLLSGQVQAYRAISLSAQPRLSARRPTRKPRCVLSTRLA
ncbi:hypothetical protein HKD37_03G006698 [Glycine soja]